MRSSDLSSGASTRIDTLGVVTTYAIFAGLWILLSDGLISILFRDPDVLAVVGALKGWLFVGVTSVLLTMMLRRLRVSNLGTAPLPVRAALGLPFWSLTLAIAGATAAGVAYTAQQRMRTESARLEALADVKAEQISDWLDERERGTPQIMRSSVLLADWFKRWRDGDEQASQQLFPRLTQLAETGGFQAVSLLDTDGRKLWSSEAAPPQLVAAIGHAAQRALRTHSMQRVGPYRGLRGNIRLDYVTPLGNPPARAVVVVHLDLRKNLLPMLEKWPVPSRTGEAVLVRRDGDRILYLSNLRHRQDSAANFSLPLNQSQLLAGQALRAPTLPKGVLVGEDYRGERALGVVRSVPGTDWVLLAKEDRAEVLGEVLGNAIWIGLSGLFALGVLTAVMILQRQRQQLLVAEGARQAQDARLQTLSLLSAVVEHTEDCIFALDREGRYILFNPAAERFTGIAAEQVLGRDEHAVFPPALASRLVADNQRIMQTGVSETADEALPGRDGPRLCVTTKSALRDASGQVVGLCGITRDITQREAIEARVRISEERLQHALDASSDALWDWNLQTGLCFLSSRYYAICGYRADEVTPDQSFLRQLVHPEDWPQVSAALEAHLAGRSATYEMDYRLVTRGQEIRWVSAKGKVVARDALGKALRLVGIVSDITERKQAESTLRTKSAELEARNAELERFNRAMIGRELDMIELKRQINDLARELGRAPPYALDFANAPQSATDKAAGTS